MRIIATPAQERAAIFRHHAVIVTACHAISFAIIISTLPYAPLLPLSRHAAAISRDGRHDYARLHAHIADITIFAGYAIFTISHCHAELRRHYHH